MRIHAAQQSRKQAFTLIDLVATTLLLGLLLFFVFPTWVDSAADARTRLCAGNLGQIGHAAAMYATDNAEQLPGNQHSQPSWARSLAAYTPTNSYRCPEAISIDPSQFTIALNDFLTPRPYGARHLDFSKRSAIPAPGETLLFAEADEAYRAYDHFHFADARENGYSADAFADQVDIERHSGSANYLFADGHVAELNWNSAARPKLTFRGSRFVHPSGSSSTPEIAQK